MNRLSALFLCLTSFLPAISYSQNTYEEQNIWTGITATYDPGKRIGFILDGGFRSFDHYTRKRKQILGRFVVFMKITNTSSFGGGFAYFKHTSYDLYGKSRNRNEFRPFLQYQFRLRKKRHDLLVRFRNEFRSFQNPESLRDRFRIQARYSFQILKPNFQFVCSAEGFYTFQKNPTTEQRYNIGLSLPVIPGVQVNPYYSIQFVSNLAVVQHVIGLQLLINLDQKNQDKK